MAQIIVAPSEEKPMYNSVFLAGGITACENWQDKVIDELSSYDITIFNPRRKNFDVTDKLASVKQINWEYERLEQMDIFSMYFCNSESLQPICMYELGRNILRMQMRFPLDWQNRIIISVENGYKRTSDVIIQTELCSKLFVDADATPDIHAQYIRNAVRKIMI